jgi:hypothetical protein
LLDATNATLTLTNFSLADAGRYSVLVNDPFGCVLSQNAMLRLQESPVITRQPADVQSYGAPATLAVVAHGTYPLTYQWRFNDIPLSGQTGAQLYFPVPQPSQAGTYSVVISNAFGSTTSSAATLSVAITDSDSDGMPDWWENANGTNPYLNDANDDPDHDGMSNIQEYWAGTEPNNSLSALKLAAALATGGKSLLLTFQAMPNHAYTLQRQSSFGGVWSSVAVVPSAPVSQSIQLTEPSLPGTQALYRLLSTPAAP